MLINHPTTHCKRAQLLATVFVWRKVSNCNVLQKQLLVNITNEKLITNHSEAHFDQIETFGQIDYMFLVIQHQCP